MASRQQLRIRIDQLRHEIADLEKQLHDEVCREQGLTVGMMLREVGGRKGHNRVGEFIGMKYSWPNVRLQKKDGSIGNRTANFYKWEAV